MASKPHRILTPVALAAMALGLSACATTSGGSPSGLAGECKGEPGQRFVGQKATAEVGAQILKATGATKLRWGPPRSAMTMDFRVERVTVSYDDAMVIDRVSCG